ncbi:MAG TPA: DinB family protein [Acidimicrobiales bacterium]|nr:DinB family protein [Acidimicrobiales bacterium]
MNADERRSLIDQYHDGVAEVHRALDGATTEELDRRPAPKEWTAREVAHHLADSETMSTIRLRRLLAEDAPLIQAYDENQFAERLHYDRPIDRSLAVFAAVRAANVELLMTLTEPEWQRAGTHSDDGPYSVETWLQIYAAHGHDHADQIRRAREGR